MFPDVEEQYFSRKTVAVALAEIFLAVREGDFLVVDTAARVFELFGQFFGATLKDSTLI